MGCQQRLSTPNGLRLIAQGCIDLLDAEHHYAAAALVRQIVETEYLGWAFSEDAQTAAADALKKLEESTKKKTLADEAKVKADRELVMAQQFQQKAQQEKQLADQYAQQKQNEANPQGRSVNVPSNSLTIKVVEFPFKVDALADAISVKQGEKLEVPIKVSRQYGFTGAINIQHQLAGGVNGLGVQNVNIPDNQTDFKFEINAQPTATVGEHLCTVRLSMNFNGAALTMERPLKITVVEVKVETK